MASKTDIANLALSHLGVGKEIANLDSEQSQEAAVMRRFYTQAQKATLRDFPWSFAGRFATLALVAEDPSETDEWAFSYRYPADALTLRRIPSGVRNETADQRIKYKVASDTNGQLIYTDQRDAKIEYTVFVSDEVRYTEDFVMALSLRLAAYAAPRLTAGDPFNLGDRALRMYLQEIPMAEVNSSNEQVPDRQPESEFIRAREGIQPTTTTGEDPTGI